MHITHCDLQSILNGIPVHRCPASEFAFGQPVETVEALSSSARTIPRPAEPVTSLQGALCHALANSEVINENCALDQ